MTYAGTVVGLHWGYIVSHIPRTFWFPCCRSNKLCNRFHTLYTYMHTVEPKLHSFIFIFVIFTLR